MAVRIFRRPDLGVPRNMRRARIHEARIQERVAIDAVAARARPN